MDLRRVMLLPALACLFGAAGDLAAASDRGSLVAELRDRLRLAEQAKEAKQLDRAEALYREVMDRAGQLSRPNLPLARAVDGLGDVERLNGKLEQAARHYRSAAAMWDGLLGPRQPRLAITLHNLGAVEAELGRRSDAIARLERALTIWEALYGPDSRQARNTRKLYDRLRTTSD